MFNEWNLLICWFNLGTTCRPSAEKHCFFAVRLERNNNILFVLVCILLGISPASDCGLPTFRNPLSVPSSRAGCKV